MQPQRNGEFVSLQIIHGVHQHTRQKRDEDLNREDPLTRALIIVIRWVILKQVERTKYKVRCRGEE